MTDHLPYTFDCYLTETTAQTIESRVKDQKRPMTQEGLIAERGGGDEGQKRGKYDRHRQKNCW